MTGCMLYGEKQPHDLSKARTYDKLLNKAFCQGKTCQFMSYTRANKTCKGKLGHLYGAKRLPRNDLKDLRSRKAKYLAAQIQLKTKCIVRRNTVARKTTASKKNSV